MSNLESHVFQCTSLNKAIVVLSAHPDNGHQYRSVKVIPYHQSQIPDVNTRGGFRPDPHKRVDSHRLFFMYIPVVMRFLDRQLVL